MSGESALTPKAPPLHTITLGIGILTNKMKPSKSGCLSIICLADKHWIRLLWLTEKNPLQVSELAGVRK